ncbi:hypothetical protein ACHAWT_010816 [Skeletonema menzelii]
MQTLLQPCSQSQTVPACASNNYYYRNTKKNRMKLLNFLLISFIASGAATPASPAKAPKLQRCTRQPPRAPNLVVEALILAPASPAKAPKLLRCIRQPPRVPRHLPLVPPRAPNLFVEPLTLSMFMLFFCPYVVAEI